MYSTATGHGWGSVWITGASSGIGWELARQLEGRCDNIAVSARSETKLAELAKTSQSISAYPVDVVDARAMAEAAHAIETAAGSIELAIFNAAYWKIMDAMDMDIAAIRVGMETNYLGVIHGINAVLPGMLRRGRGHIVIMASVAGYRGLPKSMAYGPTKAALINLAETLHLELAPRGIRVSLVNPGFVDTPATRGNPFPMPGLMPVQDAASALIDGLSGNNFEIIFPRRFVRTMKFLRILPNRVYFWIVRRRIMGGRDTV